MPHHRAALHPTVKACAQVAAAAGTFAVCCTAEGQLETGFPGIAWGHAASTPGSDALASVEEAMGLAWGLEGEILGDAWSKTQPRALLPPLWDRLQECKDIARTVSQREAEQGQAKTRTEDNLEQRAAAFLLAARQLQELRGAQPGTLPGVLHRRLVSKQTAQMLFPGGKEKPLWWQLEELAEGAGWERLTRQNCGYPWPYAPPKPGRLAYINPNALVEEYEREVGGVLDDRSIIFTIAHHAAAHTPTISQHLQQKIDAALAEGHPLHLYDPDKLEPPPSHREMAGFWEQIDRLVAQGTYKELSLEQVMDRDFCWCLSWLGCVYKGSLALSEEEKKVVESEVIPSMDKLALARAEALVNELERRVNENKAPRGAVLELLMAEQISAFTKVRPVVRGGAFGKGNKKIGLEPEGIKKASFQFPLLSSILTHASKSSWLAKADLVDYFYCIPYSDIGRKLACVVTRSPTGSLRYFQLQALSMGITDSPALAESISSVIATVASAMSPTGTELSSWSPLCDDLCWVGTQQDAVKAMETLTALLQRVGATENLAKRELGPVGTILGKTVDFSEGIVSIPGPRLFKYLILIHVARLALKHRDPQVQREITATFLSKAVGVLGWLSETTVQGPLHLAGLYAATAHARNLAQHKWRDMAVEDLEWWCNMAASGRLRGSLKLDFHPNAPPVEQIFSDASQHALGAANGDQVVWRALSGTSPSVLGHLRLAGTKERAESSALRELKAKRMALQILSKDFPPGTRVAVVSDSVPSVASLNKGRMKGAAGAKRELQYIYDLMEQRDLHVVGLYLPREFLSLPDSISKCTSQAELTCWAAQHGFHPVEIPPAELAAMQA